VKVIKKIVSVLNILSYEDELGVAELADKLNIPVATAYRILNDLTEDNLLEKDKNTKKYRLGWRMAQFGATALQQEQARFFVPLIRPYLKEINGQTRETVFLSVLKNKKFVCIAKVDGRRNVRYYAQVGKELPVPGSAPAKILLAFMPEAEQIKYMGNIKYIRYTPASISSEDELRGQFIRVVSQGYAVCDNEIEMGSKAIAVPIFDARDRVFASIAVIGPGSRIDEDFDNILHSMQKAASEASEALKLQGACVNITY
jgi:DNA-binding IclR family transcriptional regulator